MTIARRIFLLSTSMGLGCAPKEDDTSDWTGELEDSTACYHRAIPESTGEPAVVGTTEFAAADDLAPCSQASGPDLRFLWTPDESRPYRIHTGGTDFDTVLYVIEGCEGLPIACNDDFDSLQSRVAVEAEAGTRYVIVVDGYEASDAGPFQLTIQ